MSHRPNLEGFTDIPSYEVRKGIHKTQLQESANADLEAMNRLRQFPVIINPQSSVRGSYGMLVIPGTQSVLNTKAVGMVKPNVDIRKLVAKLGGTAEEYQRALQQFVVPLQDDQTTDGMAVPAITKKTASDSSPSKPQQPAESSPQEETTPRAASDRDVHDLVSQAIDSLVQGLMSRLQASVAPAASANHPPEKSPVRKKQRRMAEASSSRNGSTSPEPISTAVDNEKKASSARNPFDALGIPGLERKARRPKLRVVFVMPDGARYSAYYHWIWTSSNNDVYLIYDTRYKSGIEFIPPVRPSEPIRLEINKQSYLCVSDGRSLEFGVFSILCLPAAGPDSAPAVQRPAGYHPASVPQPASFPREETPSIADLLATKPEEPAQEEGYGLDDDDNFYVG